jgi:integral membrane sensor domain MASE1
VSIADPGTFPQPSAQGQLESLLRQVLPQVFALLVPVPILFDIFHLIPDSLRLPAEQLVDANKGWFTMFLPLGPPQGAGP